jgi:hypothetical protein
MRSMLKDGSIFILRVTSKEFKKRYDIVRDEYCYVKITDRYQHSDLLHKAFKYSSVKHI